MQIEKQLKRKLGTEFPELSHTIIRAVVWLITGTLDQGGLDKVYSKTVKDGRLSASSKELQDEFVYEVLLRTGRSICQDSASLETIKNLIQKYKDIVKKLKMEKQAKASTATTTVTNESSAASSNRENRKQKEDSEEVIVQDQSNSRSHTDDV